MCFPRPKTTQVCHILLQSPPFFSILIQIDHDLTSTAKFQGCQCGGVLHCADYPRKPRGCPAAVRADFSTRFSLCCAICRRRTTPVSVRFLGRRVYLSLLVVLLSARPAGQAATHELCQTLGVPARTLIRWRNWWQALFPATSLWQAQCARFMPPVHTGELPASLMARFTGSEKESLIRFLKFLTPLTI